MAQLLLCLLLLGLSLLSATVAQISIDETEVEGAGGGASESDTRLPRVGDPMFGATFNVEMSRKQLAAAIPNRKIQMNCQMSPPGRFRAWVKDNFVIGVEPTLEVAADGSNTFGVYYCLVDPEVGPNRYRALQFVVTEMPPDEKTALLSVRVNQDVSLTCQLNSSAGSYKWHRYSVANYQFEEISGQTDKQLSLTYATLNQDRRVGFTYYKCSDPSNLETYHAFKIVKYPTWEMIDDRMTKVYGHDMRVVSADVGAVPISVTAGSKVVLECRKTTAMDNATWFFRESNTTSPAQYREIQKSDGVKIEDNPMSSTLSIKDLSKASRGYYQCTIGRLVQYALLDLQVVVPTIHEFGQGTYDLTERPGEDNELECEIPVGGKAQEAIWRILPVPSSASSYIEIPANKSKAGFETSVSGSASTQLVTIRFRDEPRLHNYRLECRLGDELDYVILRSVTNETTSEPSDTPDEASPLIPLLGSIALLILALLTLACVLLIRAAVARKRRQEREEPADAREMIL